MTIEESTTEYECQQCLIMLDSHIGKFPLEYEDVGSKFNRTSTADKGDWINLQPLK